MILTMKTVQVKDLLNISSLEDKLKLVTINPAGLENELNFVTIMEAPDLHEWVAGGEFILTTWYAFSKNPELQLAAFEQLAQKISAIGIKTGRFIDKIPPEILAIAEKYNLPVFEVSKKSKFREITQAITTEIQNYQTNLLIEVDNYYQNLITTSLNTDNINELLLLFRKKGALSSFVLDPKAELLGYSLGSNHNHKKMLEWVAVFKKFYRENINISQPYTRIEDLHIFICQGRRNLLGFFVIVDSVRLSEKVKLFGQQTSSFLSLKLMERHNIKQRETNQFWHNFIKGKYNANLDEAVSYLHKLGLKNKQGYTMLLMENIPESEKVSLIIDNAVNNSLLSFTYDDKVILLLSGDYYADLESNWAQAVQEYTKKQPNPFLLVVAPPIKNIDILLENYVIAKNTFDFFQSNNYRELVDSQRYILLNLVFKNTHTAEYTHMQREVLKPLKDYDSRYKTSLMMTLKQALLSNTLEKSASNLHIHINTLRYRLGKVEELTGKSFFNIIDRYTLMMACILDTQKEHQTLL